ncbi:MAG: O-antigen ligase family protein [Firmicutes bacterium]|nr:O-antigen ligase family protein [Bacillota bacterium]
MVNDGSPVRKSKITFQSVGWYLAFGLIPFGSSLPGLFVLLVERFIRLFKPYSGPKIPVSNLKIVRWANRLFLIFLGWMVISGIFSPRPEMALAQTLGFSLIVWVYIFGAQKTAGSHFVTAERYLPVFVAASFGSSIIALLRFFIFHMDRAENLPAGSINGLGTILVLSMGLIIGYLYGRGGRWRYVLIPYLGVTLAALLANKSRGAWLGFFVMLLCFGFLNRKFRIIAAIILAILIIVFLTLPAMQTRILSLTPANQLDRILMYQATLKMIQDYPVFGIGAGVYPYVFPEYQIKDPRVVPENHPFAHNLFLQLAAEFGLVGLVIFCTILGLIIFMSFKLARTQNHFYQGIFAALIGVLIHQQVDLPIWGFDIGGAFWLLFGLIIGFYQFEFGRNRNQNLAPSQQGPN